MGTIFSDKRISRIILFAALALAVMSPAVVHAASAVMQDYCQVPPFIGVTKPNLLLMIDNSASMDDLQYVDTGRKLCNPSATECVTNFDCPNKVCSTTTTRPCAIDSDCPTGEFCKPTETCSTVRRNATYCYDESFKSTNAYEGYFDQLMPNTNQTQYYQYDLVTGHFVPIAAFPAACAGTFVGANVVKTIAGTLCVGIDTNTTPPTLKGFIASGKYLNWLSASKFDIEKSILTGGKYDAASTSLLAESRGCVGRKFVKQALSTDFINYDSSAATNPNIVNQIGLTFGVRGPVDLSSPFNVSAGGQTYIDLFYGSYNSALCQKAITDYADPTVQKQTFINDIGACIGYTATNKNTCQFPPSPICTTDADCGYFAAPAGACLIASPGMCGNFSGGVCNAAGDGICTANNGTCTGAYSVCSGKDTKVCNSNADCSSKGWGYCIRTCVGGGKSGSVCNDQNGNADCAMSTCTAGRTGTCNGLNSDCDTKKCGNAGLKFGQTCTVAADCNVGTCTSGKPATTACLANADCNLAGGACTAPAAAAGNVCNADADCTVTGLGHCLAPATTQVKSTYGQSMHSCYQFKNGTDVGTNEIQQVSNPSGCNQMYAQVKTCIGGSANGRNCSGAADCPGGACMNGPNSIEPGSAVLLCSSAYAGYCATTADNWVNTIWVAREYASADECILAKYREYCGAVTAPPVTDPTDDPSNTTNFQNLPAILSDIGVEGQLGTPFASMTVQIQKGSVPTGLIQDFASMIRIGAMTFDFNGSKYECGTMKYCSNNHAQTCTVNADCGTALCVTAVPCPYVCSNNTSQTCSRLPDGSTMDCPGGSCVLSSTLATDSNRDGSQVLADSYIGDPIPTTPNGGHGAAGIVTGLDGIRAGAWTPFSEAMYNAIGYYAETATTTRLTAQMLNPTHPDFFTPLDTTPKAQPSQSNCQKNNVLLITDGQPTADLNSTVTGLIAANAGRFPAADYSLNYNTTFDNACYLYAGSRNFDDLAWLAQHRNIHDFSTTPTYDRDRIRTYTVYSGTGTLTQPDCTAKTDAQIAALDECQPDNLMCKAARNGKGTYYLAQDPAALKVSLKNAFLEIAAKATSGTAASVLASGEGSGANLIQALFYPRRTFDFNTETLWAGSLQNLWYFVDPFFSNSNIREDTTADKILNLRNDYVVSLRFDNSPTVNKVRVDRSEDTNGDGSPDAARTTIDIERIGSLWEAGNTLWSRTAARNIYTDCGINSANCILDASSRSTGVMNFSTANFDTATRQSYLQAAGAAESANIINYTLGTDIPGYRTRMVAMDLNANNVKEVGETREWKLGDVLNSTPKIASWMPLNTFNMIYGDATYGMPFQTLNPSDGDYEGAFITSRKAMDDATPGTGYRNRGMAFAGANDGMLHAFRLGTLQLKWQGTGSATDPTPAQGTTMHARLLRTCSKSNKVCTADTDCPGDTCPQLGQEMWAFIPKNSLPYLKYIADLNYCHVYTVDLTPFIFDASIEGPDSGCADASGNYWNCTRTRDSWRTVVIGGMRYGGGCKAKVCSVTTATKCAKDGDCPAGETCGNPSSDTIGTPLLDPADSTKGLGYSSYFALDVTESLADASKPPRLLWEFAHEELGLTSSAPAVVRIKALRNPSAAFDPVSTSPGYNPPEDAPGTRDGKWFVVLGSGPTGPINDTQMLGRSNQNLKVFVFDLKKGPGTNNVNVHVIDTTIPEAFAGSMLNSTFDSNLDYQDDVVYFGYVKKNSVADIMGNYHWTDGGVGRLLVTRGGLNALDVNNWEFSKLIDGVGPVTSAVVKLQNNKTQQLWTYFGTGRYIYKTSTEADDNDGQRTLYGVTDPCFNGNPWPAGPFNASCTAAAYTRIVGDLNDATDVNNAGADPEGWKVDMEASVTDPDPSKSLGAERVITDPLATSSGMVFFTTFSPYYDICTLGGKSYVWALKYDTAESPGAMLKGKALVQVSTGSIEQVDMQTMFTQKGARRTAAMEGVPPTAQGLAIISSPPPVKRVLHMKER